MNTRQKFLNLAEHFVTRGSDALTSLFLLWVLDPETFGKLGFAQAKVAPLLILMLSPEAVLYRDYKEWALNGRLGLQKRLWVFRGFAYFKLSLALILSFLFSSEQNFYAMMWAWLLVLTPQILGPDREFLRLSLNLKSLNFLTGFQKSLFALGTIIFALFFKGNLFYLTFFLTFGLLASVLLALLFSRQSLATFALGSDKPPKGLEILKSSIVGFSFWSHINGVIVGVIQTLDVLFLGVFFAAQSPELIGTYSAALKLANMVIFLPTAFANIFGVSWGRGQDDLFPTKNGLKFLALSLLAAAIWLVVSPFVLELIFRSKLQSIDTKQLGAWMIPMVFGSAFFGGTHYWSTYLSLKDSIKKLFINVYIPWGVLSFLIYGGTAFFCKTNLLADWVGPLEAWNNLIVGVTVFLLLWRLVRQRPAA